ncbi:MAG: hypothetical protein WAT39_07595 [Planctomycetota bacterium]
MLRSARSVLLASLLAACGHGGHSHAEARPAEARLVSILVEVYDPATNLVWENVSVRIVEVDQEWAAGTYVNQYEEWFLTDGSGRVYLDEYTLADAEVGFLEDGLGRAVLGPYRDEDEATVVLEIDALGFMPVFVEVRLSWNQPDVFIEVPFF